MLLTELEVSNLSMETIESPLTIRSMNGCDCWKIGYALAAYRFTLMADFVQMLPEIRHDLFGANENRKFYT